MHQKLNPLPGLPHLIFATTYESRFYLQEKKLRHRGWTNLLIHTQPYKNSGLFPQGTACRGEHELRIENLRDADFGFMWRKLLTARAHLGMCNQGRGIIGPACTSVLKSQNVWMSKIMPANPKVFWFLDTIIHLYRPHPCFEGLSLGQPHHCCVYGICFAHSSQRAGSGVLSATLSHKHRLCYCFALENKAGLSKGTKTDFQRRKSKGLGATHTASSVWWMAASFLPDSLFWVLCFLSVSADALSPQEDGPDSNLWVFMEMLLLPGLVRNGQRPAATQGGSLSLSPPTARPLFVHSRKRAS